TANRISYAVIAKFYWTMKSSDCKNDAHRQHLSSWKGLPPIGYIAVDGRDTHPLITLEVARHFHSENIEVKKGLKLLL
ncbi:MAG: hypothetical protein PVH27_16410, partial [Desulfobacterales bacterium]